MPFRYVLLKGVFYVQMFFTQLQNRWKQDASYFTEMPTLIVFALKASSFPRHSYVSSVPNLDRLPNSIWCHKSSQYIRALDWDLSWAERNFPPSAGECENSLQSHHSAQWSSKHPSEATKHIFERRRTQIICCQTFSVIAVKGPGTKVYSHILRTGINSNKITSVG